MTNHDESGAPKDSFLSDFLKHYFRLSGVPLKLCRFILGRAIILSVKFISKQDKAGTIHTNKTQFKKSIILSKPASIYLSTAFLDEENKNQ